MLNRLIRFSLHHRPLVLMASVLLMVFGYQTLTKLPVEVLPDMTKPTVTLLTECPGLAPEEVEMLVTQPLESAIQGVAGLDRVRSNSDVGLSLVFAEFAWGTDIYRARQLVQERVQAVLGNLPKDVTPGMTPVSSLMGEILLVGVKSNKKPGEPGYMAPRDLRTLADWTLRRRLQSINGVADVLNIGGGVKQVQVQPDPNRMQANGVSLEEINIATSKAAGNATSGFLQAGPKEIMVRNLGMSTSLEELGKTVVKVVKDRPILLSDVATLDYGVQIMRGDASVNGEMGVIMSIDKSPGFDTLRITADIEKALAELGPTLPEGVELEMLFRQGDFISHAMKNLWEAIVAGAVMVLIVLFLFLMSIRTTLITVLAMPLSFAVTLLVFRLFDISVNSMTLGGLAVAIGMVVDDAIVDVENVFRRLRENASLANPLPRMEVIATASGEVRNSILYATVLIILVFLPLLGLEGLEGRLFTPIAIATMVSMAGSFVVSLTVIPVMCSLLLKPKEGKDHGDGFVVRAMKGFVKNTFLRAALGAPLVVIAVVGTLLVAAFMLYPLMGKEFLPAFNEGSATISLANPPGTSLAQTNEVGEVGVRLLYEIEEVKSVGRRAGRAERDDHVVPVSVNEFDVEFWEGGRSRELVFKDVRDKLATIPGTAVNVGQPIGHRLSHMLSGVSAKIAVKLFGPNLDVLREKGAQIRDIGKTVPGLTDLYLEAQVPIPQLKIEVNRERAMAYGIQPGALNEQMSALIGGTALTELREGERSVDLVLRLPAEWRDSPEKLGDVLVEASGGRRVPLRLVADIRESKGPNVINRENTLRRIVISANTSERDLQTIVQRWEKEVKEKLDLPQGYYVSFEGEFRAQQEAARTIAFYFVLVLMAIVILLYGYFRSLSLALQVMLNIPLALIGGLVLTWFLINNISIATIVGFIAVGGVAARNGIMMISHYLHLMKH
ncbi:MAG TPA: efflux RND transporter permease subunit, partial [Candidatus Saccharimonadia bacterium]|nr:efflux RND transporter permease subunit [Candidatus Saccharimonadia bacterium]